MTENARVENGCKNKHTDKQVNGCRNKHTDKQVDIQTNKHAALKST